MLFVKWNWFYGWTTYSFPKHGKRACEMVFCSATGSILAGSTWNLSFSSCLWKKNYCSVVNNFGVDNCQPPAHCILLMYRPLPVLGSVMVVIFLQRILFFYRGWLFTKRWRKTTRRDWGDPRWTVWCYSISVSW